MWLFKHIPRLQVIKHATANPVSQALHQQVEHVENHYMTTPLGYHTLATDQAKAAQLLN